MSISDEQRARIRALFFAEHWKVGTIASELGLHADTVKSAIGAETFVSRGPDAGVSGFLCTGPEPGVDQAGSLSSK